MMCKDKLSGRRTFTAVWATFVFVFCGVLCVGVASVADDRVVVHPYRFGLLRRPEATAGGDGGNYAGSGNPGGQRIGGGGVESPTIVGIDPIGALPDQFVPVETQNSADIPVISQPELVVDGSRIGEILAGGALGAESVVYRGGNYNELNGFLDKRTGEVGQKPDRPLAEFERAGYGYKRRKGHHKRRQQVVAYPQPVVQLYQPAANYPQPTYHQQAAPQPPPTYQPQPTYHQPAAPQPQPTYQPPPQPSYQQPQPQQQPTIVLVTLEKPTYPQPPTYQQPARPSYHVVQPHYPPPAPAPARPVYHDPQPAVSYQPVVLYQPAPPPPSYPATVHQPSYETEDECPDVQENFCYGKEAGHYSHPGTNLCFVQCDHVGRAFAKPCAYGTSWRAHGYGPDEPAHANMCS